MDFAYLLGGGAPVMKSYQIGVTNANAALGIPYTVPAAGTAGVVIGTTTGATDLVGISVDNQSPRGTQGTGTYGTAQIAGNTDPAQYVRLIINPNAVWRALMSGGATENTALTLYPVTTASTDGLAITTASEWSSPTFDEGHAWGYDGANAGIARKVTSVSSTAGTLTVALPSDTAVGDNFLRAPWTPMQAVTVQLTTNLYQADASIAVGTGAPFRVIEMALNSLAHEGRTNSFVFFMSNSHALNLA
jgi:hypothetical protein